MAQRVMSSSGGRASLSPSPSGEDKGKEEKPARKHISDDLLQGLVERLEQLKALSAHPAAVESNIAAVKEKMMLRQHASSVVLAHA